MLKMGVGIVALGLMASLCGIVSAQTKIDLNAAPGNILNAAAVIDARIKMGYNNNDQYLTSEDSTGNFNNSGPQKQAEPFHNTNNNIGTGSIVYQTFQVQHTVSAGHNIFTYSLLNGTASGKVTGGSDSVLTYDYKANNIVLPAFNLLHLYLTADNGQNSSAPSSSITAKYTNASFTSLDSGLVVAGSLLDNSVTAFGGNSATNSQWLATSTGTDLNSFNWIFQTTIELDINGTTSKVSDERLKFDFTGETGDYIQNSVPEPNGTTILVGIGITSMGLLLRRRIRARIHTQA